MPPPFTPEEIRQVAVMFGDCGYATCAARECITNRMLLAFAEQSEKLAILAAWARNNSLGVKLMRSDVIAMLVELGLFPSDATANRETP